MLRYVFDQTFATGHTGIYLELWKVIHPEMVSGVMPWAVRPLDGVAVHLDGDPQDPVVEVRFTKLQNVHFAHLSRDFAVTPGRRYELEAQVRTTDLTSSEGVRLLVASPRGTVIESRPFRRSSDWTQVRLHFRAGADQVLRLSVVRYRSSRLDNEIAGRVFVKEVRVVHVD